MLCFSEDLNRFVEFVNGLDNFRTGFGKSVPINVGILSDCLNDGVKVLLYRGYVDLAHVENILIKTYL